MTRILLIEDKLEIRENTMELLELAGYEVITSVNGKVGLSMAFQILPDLILCDVHMPEMNGLEVLLHVKADPRTSKTPFIFVTASAEKKEIQTGIDMGADDYLCKPFEVGELLDVITRTLAKSNLQAGPTYLIE